MSTLLTDPLVSAWVSASAGTGKTKLLIDRLVRLLLSGSAPSTLMCLTYTRAAAGEMLERLQKILNNWQTLPEGDLQTSLTHLLGTKPTPSEITRARSLASICRDDPVAIQTLHSFATTLLRRAGETRRLIEDHELRTLWNQVCFKTFQKGEHHKAWDILAQYITWNRADELFWQLYQNRFKWLRVQAYYGTLEAENKALLSLIPHSPCDRPNFESEWENWKNHAFFASFGEKKPWLDWIQQPHIQKLFLTLKGEPRKRVPPHPLMADWQQAMTEAYHYHLHHDWLLENINLKTIAWPLLQAMDRAKQAQHVWDYGDLLEQAMNLLENDPHTMERLHNQLHHILVDEAQDTSPEQWAIIRFLVRTFLIEPSRTLFVVGDLKQSIYSFQGADPDLFAALEHDFAEHFHSRKWIRSTLDASWRSTAPVLQIVDTVFHIHKQGVHHHENIQHKLTRHRAPGRVELWPLVAPSPSETKQPWRTPPLQEHASIPLAEEISDRVHSILNKGEILPSTNAPVQPHDIWILFTRRGPLMGYIEKALLKKGIPTSGVDRLSLWDHLLVQDLMALARFVLMHHDDWSLACLLKSPFFKNPLTEEQLFNLCNNRETSLWQRLPSLFPSHAHALGEWIQIWQKGASPSEWFTHVWQACQKRYWDSFGPMVDDVAASFFQEVMRFEQQYAPSLEAFVSQNRHDLIKRHVQPNQGVHLTTVHSSKGLQAPIIILADATDAPRPQQDDFVWSFDPPLMALRPTKDLTKLANLYNQHNHAVLSENRRLLYVALTRAADQLYATGLQRKSEKPSWYDLMQDALTELGCENTLTYGSFNIGQPWKNSSTQKKISETICFPKLNPIYKQHQNETSDEAKRGTLLHKWLECMTPHSNPHAFLEKYDPEKLLNVEKLLVCQSWLTHPDYMWIFSGQAEVDIVDNTGKLYRMDRLVVSENDVWILDFKSGFLGKEQTKHYHYQMNTYRQIVQKLYPHHTVHICLVDISGENPNLLKL